MMNKEELEERISIKVDSGTPEAEARRQAIQEQKKLWLEAKKEGRVFIGGKECRGFYVDEFPGNMGDDE